ncbi:MAG TPA: ankyrin repeat domain-containing protein, partial [Gammaproteobacteria bacterium]|nr:ankyrin repeat domain-containing protein [Gammaproteobacteria bacterium]
MQRIQPDNNFDQFIISVKLEKLEQVKTALKPQYHINVNQPDINKYGMTALHFAAWDNYVEIAKILLNNKADINCLDHRGLSPLMIAAIRGHENMVVLFLEQGNVIKINQQLNRIFGMTALHYAAFYGNEKIVKLLLEHGAYTDFKTSEPQYIDRGSKDEVYIRKDSTPLQIAAQRNFTNIVCVLLKHGANFENIIDRIPAIKNGRLHFFLQVIQEMLPMNNKD